MNSYFEKLVKNQPTVNRWYKGTMCLCPIYYGECVSGEWVVAPRNILLSPALAAAIAIQHSINLVNMNFDPIAEPRHILKIQDEPCWSRYGQQTKEV